MPVRRIWLCADDYGIAPGVNAAIRDLIVRGRINATSVMVLGSSFDAGAIDKLRIAHADSGAAIGLHLTLTAPYRPLAPSFRPRRDETFFPVGATLALTLLRRFDAAGLAAEIDAQFDAFEGAFGRAPDFIDGHQHVQLFPQIRDAVLASAQARAPAAWVRQCGSAQFAKLLQDPKGLLIDALSRAFRHRAAALGIRTNPAFAGTYRYRPDADFSALFPRFLDGLPDGALVMCHPGFVDAQLAAVDPLTLLREREHAYLAGDAFDRALAEAGVALA